MIKSLSASLAAVGTETHLTPSFVREIASVDVTNSGGEIALCRHIWHTKWHTQPCIDGCDKRDGNLDIGGREVRWVTVVPIVLQTAL